MKNNGNGANSGVIMRSLSWRPFRVIRQRGHPAIRTGKCLMPEPIKFKPRLRIVRHIERGRYLGTLWQGLLPTGDWKYFGGVRIFSLADALKSYRRRLAKVGYRA